MNQTLKTHVLRATTLAALCAANTFAIPNPIDGGTTYTNATDATVKGTLQVGFFDPNNTLIVANGSKLKAEELVVGFNKDTTNNLVSVTSGSWLVVGDASTNGLAPTGGIVVGGADGEEAILVDNASKLEGDYLYFGLSANDSAIITLAGEDSELNIAQDAYVGYIGSSNTVEVGSGAAMNVGGLLTVGSAAGSNNYVNVSGDLFVNTTNDIQVLGDDNGINVESGGTLQVGGDVDTSTIDDLGIDLQSNSNLELGGELTLGKNKIDGNLNIILNDDLSTETAIWQSDALTAVGKTSSYNSLTFTNGATGIASNYFLLGQNSGANYNELNVGGTGSTFTATTHLSVGGYGKYNELNIGSAGSVDVQGTLYVGYNESATGNAVNVGSNGTLNVEGTVLVGANGGSNEFNIDHGQVTANGDFVVGRTSANNTYTQTGGTNTVAGEFIIGKTESASGTTGTVNSTDTPNTSGNLAMVEDDALLDLQSLTVGLEGSGSILAIRDGATVNVDGDAVIGESVGDNYIYLQRDSNTQFNVAGDLVVGKEGGSNRFAIYGGTATIDGNLYLGASTNQHEVKNFIHLETSNAVLNVANALYIGASNSLNTLDLADGATATAQDLFVGAYEGVSNNVVTVSGEDSLLTVSNKLTIGSTSGSDNAVYVNDGGTLAVEQSNIVIAGTNNTLTIESGGILKTASWDFSAMTNSMTNIVLSADSTLHLLGVLSGTNAVDGEFNVILDGTDASWEGENLYVGRETDNNSLTLTNGAQAVASKKLYIGYESSDNTVTVGGAGSLLDVGTDLYIGTMDEDSTHNTLEALAGASVLVGNDMYLYRGAVLKIDSISQVSVEGDYMQDGYSTLYVGVSSNQADNINLVVEGTVAFSNSIDQASYPVIAVYDDGVGESNVVSIVKADSITADGEALTSGTIGAYVQTNLLLGFSTTVSNANGYSYIVLDDFITRTIADAGDLEGELRQIADEINAMDIAGNANASNMVDIISGMSSASEISEAFDAYYGQKQSSVPAHNVINMGLQSVSEQLTVRADNTRARRGAASADVSANTPAGASGPHQAEQELQGWISAYGTWGEKDSAGGFGGYDVDIGGFMVGADMAVAENILFGLAGGRGTGTADKGDGAETDTKTIYAAAYASMGTQDWFADGGIIFGASDIDTTYGTTFDTTADYSARNLAFYLGGGKEMTGKYLIYTPQISFLGNYYKQDGFTEEASNAVERDVEGFDTFYLQSSLGCSMGMYMGLGNITFKPEIRAHWLHEWLDGRKNLHYTLVGGNGEDYLLNLQAPEEDILKLGVGAAAKLGEYLEVRADLDTRMGKDYSDYTLLGSLRYQF
ncbi:autotransporter domain-containing protein [Pontiella sp.]|uniref:autotransporter domain-containing protein n=1 Tax=Pontiella sp. TaxID=2837462 RepID=UPI0035641C16